LKLEGIDEHPGVARVRIGINLQVPMEDPRFHEVLGHPRFLRCGRNRQESSGIVVVHECQEGPPSSFELARRAAPHE
jgi:hypothetical protein